MYPICNDDHVTGHIIEKFAQQKCQHHAHRVSSEDSELADVVPTYLYVSGMCQKLEFENMFLEKNLRRFDHERYKSLQRKCNKSLK